MRRDLVGCALVSIMFACGEEATAPEQSGATPSGSATGTPPAPTNPNDSPAPPGSSSSSGGGGTTSSGGSSGSSGALPGKAAKIALVSGTGATLLENWPGGALRVRVTDANDKGVANVEVKWSVVSGEGANIASPAAPTDLTDADGYAARLLYGVYFNPSVPHGETTIRATSALGSVDFTTVTVHAASGLGPVPPHITLLEPASRDLGTMKAGSTKSGGAKVQFVIQGGVFLGKPLPKGGIRFVDGQDKDKPAAVRCANGIPLSDGSGIATCDVLATGAPGEHFFSLLAGEQSIFTSFRVTIVP